MSAKRSHGPTVSVQFQHLIHQPTWNKSSHGKFANIRALPSPPSRLHTGQGGKVTANGARERFTASRWTVRKQVPRSRMQSRSGLDVSGYPDDVQSLHLARGCGASQNARD
jgi:hypothetical protein